MLTEQDLDSIEHLISLHHDFLIFQYKMKHSKDGHCWSAIIEYLPKNITSHMCYFNALYKNTCLSLFYLTNVKICINVYQTILLFKKNKFYNLSSINFQNITYLKTTQIIYLVWNCVNNFSSVLFLVLFSEFFFVW